MNERDELNGLNEYILLTKGIELSEEQKDSVAHFIARLLGNMKLNEVISKNPELMANESTAIADVLDIPFHTRRLDEFTFLSNAESGYVKLVNKEKLNEDEKLSLRQFAIMHEIVALIPIFKRLELLDILGRNNKIDQFHETVMKCREIMDFLTLKIKVESHPKLGFLVSELRRKNAMNESINYFDAIVKNYVQKELGAAQRPTPSNPG